MASERFFRQVRGGDFQLVVSDIIRREIAAAPADVAALFLSSLEHAEIAPITPEALALRQAYIDAGILTAKSLDDALHVALATTSKCPLIVSWNFKHIVHFQKIPLYNDVNAANGYGKIAIHSPSEVIEDEDCEEI